MDKALLATLEMTAAAMTEARDDWWIIGSAAVALHGASPIEVHDVDILLSVADARRILPGLGLPLTPGVPDTRFRSDYYCQWSAPPVQVDFMAGFHVYGEAMIPETREALAGVFVPSRAELLATLRHFGRPKDLKRAALLEVTSSPANP